MNEVTINNGFEDLGIFEKENNAWVSSRTISEMFDKRHDNVIMKIDEILKTKDDFTNLNFKVSEYKDSTGKKNKEYLLNRKSFALVVMGFTGDKAMNFKKMYIEAFENMFNLIQTRIMSKEGYKIMTDAIRDNIKDAKFYTYSNEADMVNKIVLGMTAKQFKELNNVDDIRDNLIQDKLSNLNKAQILNAQLIKSNMKHTERSSILIDNFFEVII